MSSFASKNFNRTKKSQTAGLVKDNINFYEIYHVELKDQIRNQSTMLIFYKQPNYVQALQSKFFPKDVLFLKLAQVKLFTTVQQQISRLVGIKEDIQNRINQ